MAQSAHSLLSFLASSFEKSRDWSISAKIASPGAFFFAQLENPSFYKTYSCFMF